MTTEIALKAFTEAVQTAHAAFTKNKRQLSDLSPRFWVAWLDLEAALRDGVPFDELSSVFRSAYKRFGSPGDFGYGTPEGDGLAKVYRSWGELCKVRPVTEAVSKD